MVSAERRALILKLHDEHADSLLRRARAMGTSCDQAEDLLQEVLLAAATTLAVVENWAGWLHGAITFKVISLRKKRQPEALRDDLDPHFEAADAEGVLQARQELQLVERALDKLKANRRDLLLLCDVEGLSAAEAAKLLGDNEAGAPQKLWRARQEFKEHLDKLRRQSPAVTANEDRHAR